jgi:uncharacterized protein YndB with AHSA1/START domain
MSEYRIESRIQVRAPASIIWEALADSRRWPTWSPNDAASLEKEGTPVPDGVGAVRVMRTGKITVREKVVGFEPERRLAYQLVSGLPVKDYVAEVLLAPKGGDQGTTEVVWRATFKPQLPLTGKWARRRLQEVLDQWSAALARHAERVAAEATT